MRDLNNDASRRCRQARKRKFQDLLDEKNELEAANIRLKSEYESKKNEVESLKQLFLSAIANKTPAAAAAAVVSREQPIVAVPVQNQSAPSPSVASAVEFDTDAILEEFFGQN